MKSFPNLGSRPVAAPYGEAGSTGEGNSPWLSRVRVARWTKLLGSAGGWETFLVQGNYVLKLTRSKYVSFVSEYGGDIMVISLLSTNFSGGFLRLNCSTIFGNGLRLSYKLNNPTIIGTNQTICGCFVSGYE